MNKEQFDAREATETFRIVRTLVSYFNSADQKDWDRWRDAFLDELTIDFGAIKPAQKTKADDLLSWAKIAYSKMVTQHMVSNHVVQISGKTAKVYSYGHALHFQKVKEGDEHWFLYCRYDHELVLTDSGWKVTRLQMSPTHQEGNLKMMDLAFAEASGK